MYAGQRTDRRPRLLRRPRPSRRQAAARREPLTGQGELLAGTAQHFPLAPILRLLFLSRVLRLVRALRASNPDHGVPAAGRALRVSPAGGYRTAPHSQLPVTETPGAGRCGRSRSVLDDGANGSAVAWPHGTRLGEMDSPQATCTVLANQVAECCAYGFPSRHVSMITLVDGDVVALCAGSRERDPGEGRSRDEPRECGRPGRTRRASPRRVAVRQWDRSPGSPKGRASWRGTGRTGGGGPERVSGKARP